jgi:hypothetical protein
MSKRAPWRVTLDGRCFRVINIATTALHEPYLFKSLAHAQEICDELNILSGANLIKPKQEENARHVE